MLVLLVLEDLDEQLVAVFLDAGVPARAVLQELGEYSVCVAKRCRGLNRFFWIGGLHQCVEALEQIESEKELLILRFSGQIEVERCNQGDEKLTFARVISLIGLLLLTFVLLEQVIDPGED